MTVKVSFSSFDNMFPTIFSESSQRFGVAFDEKVYVDRFVDFEPFVGDYEVIPKVSEQRMPTKGKVMRDDVTVKSIPLFSTSNLSGGNTIYIGKEI